MDQIDPSSLRKPIDDGDEAAPRLSDWLWKPRYAKVWWIAIALWELRFFLPSAIFEPARPVHIRANYEWIALLLHPLSALFILGLLFFQDWWRFHFGSARNWNHTEMPSHDGNAEFAIHRLSSDPVDPLDPEWLTTPANPSSEAWRDTHLR